MNLDRIVVVSLRKSLDSLQSFCNLNASNHFLKSVLHEHASNSEPLRSAAIKAMEHTDHLQRLGTNHKTGQLRGCIQSGRDTRLYAADGADGWLRGHIED